MNQSLKTITIEYADYSWELSANTEYANFYRAELKANAQQYMRQVVMRENTSEKERRPRYMQLYPYYYDILGCLEKLTFSSGSELVITEAEAESVQPLEFIRSQRGVNKLAELVNPAGWCAFFMQAIKDFGRDGLDILLDAAVGLNRDTWYPEATANKVDLDTPGQTEETEAEAEQKISTDTGMTELEAQAYLQEQAAKLTNASGTSVEVEHPDTDTMLAASRQIMGRAERRAKKKVATGRRR
jgi:hypothetical protein